jgi:hypothetical protein
MSKRKVALVAVAAFVAVDALAIITGNGDYMFPVITALVVIPAYFAPTFGAASRDNSNAGAVAVVNVILGWTCIGWIVALAMAAGGVPSAQRRVPYVSALPASANAATNATKKCPDCAETVLADARCAGTAGSALPTHPVLGPLARGPHRHSLRTVRLRVRITQNRPMRGTTQSYPRSSSLRCNDRAGGKALCKIGIRYRPGKTNPSKKEMHRTIRARRLFATSAASRRGVASAVARKPCRPHR